MCGKGGNRQHSEIATLTSLGTINTQPARIQQNTNGKIIDPKSSVNFLRVVS